MHSGSSGSLCSIGSLRFGSGGSAGAAGSGFGGSGSVRGHLENRPETQKQKRFAKIVTVRAVNLSTGPFCTEFWCEQLCDDGIFQKKFENLVEI